MRLGVLIPPEGLALHPTTLPFVWFLMERPQAAEMTYCMFKPLIGGLENSNFDAQNGSFEKDINTALHINTNPSTNQKHRQIICESRIHQLLLGCCHVSKDKTLCHQNNSKDSMNA